MQRSIGNCVEIASPIATPVPTFSTLLHGINPKIRVHSLVNMPFPQLPVPVQVSRVAFKNSCLWRIRFVIFPLNDGDIIGNLDEPEEDDEDICVVLLFCYIMIIFLLDK
jgi:hypothetical protein